MSRLYIVSTPIGNLGDLTRRAVEVLRSADRILAEDTRRTAILCRHHGIDTPLVSAHEHNERSRIEQVAEWLSSGEVIALVSDAGTPLVSDPGGELVRALIDRGHDVAAIPGPSAALAALVVSGLPVEPFTFYGFLPRSGAARTRRLEELASLRHTAVLYESPGRLVKLLEDLGETSSPARGVAVARELTKVHEEVFRGTLAEASSYFGGRAVRGEVVVVVGGVEAVGVSAAADEVAVAALASGLLAEGVRPSEAAREVSRRLGVSRNLAYEVVQRLKEEPF